MYLKDACTARMVVLCCLSTLETPPKLAGSAMITHIMVSGSTATFSFFFSSAKNIVFVPRTLSQHVPQAGGRGRIPVVQTNF